MLCSAIGQSGHNAGGNFGENSFIRQSNELKGCEVQINQMYWDMCEVEDGCTRTCNLISQY